MNRVELAVRTFFWIFFKKDFRERIAPFFEYDENQLSSIEQKVDEDESGAVVLPRQLQANRSDAIALLALLQREGRLIDFLKESISDYSDAQIGAAVRDVHRDCAAVLERSFEIVPLVEKEEGSQMQIVSGFDPDETRLTGNVTGNPPYNGILRHCGWKASKCELPQWQGSSSSAMVVAPAEVEL
ncbi:MAG: DUF2760 domain-containing protein [Chitinispirillia bacterium]|nr:DUF2760 domain-containing protein [Chitinispirillia bacterium]